MSAEIKQVTYLDPLVLSIDPGNLIPREIWQTHIEQSKLWVGLWKSELVILWGIFPLSLLSEKAFIWSWATPKIKQCKKSFLRLSKKMLAYHFQEYTELFGYCVGSSIWLKHLGAEFTKGNKVNTFVLRKI